MDPNTIDPNVIAAAISLDPNVLYYTYSTIPQTLAGAFGILGVFLLFYLQNLNQTIKGVCSTIHTGGRDPVSNLRQLYTLEDWDGLLNFIKGKKLGDLFATHFSMSEEQLTDYKSLLSKTLDKRDMAYLNLRSIIRLTIPAIIAPLFLLPFVQLLSKNIFLFAAPLLCTLLLSAYCVYNYGAMILMLFRAKMDKLQNPEKTKVESG